MEKNSPDNCNWLLNIGGGDEQIPSIYIGQKLGYKVVCFDGNKNSPATRIADAIEIFDLKDKEKALDLCKKYNVRAIIPTPLGRITALVGYLNDALKLNGPSEMLCDICTDKTKFYTKMEEIGINIPTQKFYKNSDIIETSNIPFPCIIKPIDGAGSRGVKLVNNISELMIHVKENISYFFNGVLIQQFIEGANYSVDGIVENGKSQIVCVRKKIMTPLPYRVEVSYQTTKDFIKEFSEIFSTITTKLIFKNGVFHADLVVTKDDIYIIEMSPRPSGLGISYELIPAITGNNIIENYLCNILDITKKNTKSELPYKSGMLFFIYSEKNGKKIPINIDDLIKTFPIISYNQNVFNPTINTSIKNVSDIIENGYFIIEGNTQEELEITRSNILKKIILYNE